MLILSRSVGQTIVIGQGKITITLIETGNGTAKIGVDAPKDVEILKGEVFERISTEKKADS